MGDRELCYERNLRCRTTCDSRACRHWIAHKGGLNCTLIAASAGPMTLQQIGEIIGVTRMRVCQLEKRILDEVRSDPAIAESR